MTKDQPRLLIANRGEGAARVLRTAKAMGLFVICIYAPEDEANLYLSEADISVPIMSENNESTSPYMNLKGIMEIAREQEADLLHPVYGYLAESPELADACKNSDVTFVGPSARNMLLLGQKHSARETAVAVGVPVVPGSGICQDLETLVNNAASIGYPVMMKATDGGGGISNVVCENDKELETNFYIIQRQSASNFGGHDIFLEKYVEHARHIEVQVFGLENEVLAVGTRECSIQRRLQKVVEECPGPLLDRIPNLGHNLMSKSETLCQAVGYQNAGTVEWLVDMDTDEYYFMEVNTRLQVEHCVTEEVFGINLVQWQLSLALDSKWRPEWKFPEEGATRSSIQCRLYCEDPMKNYVPCTGDIICADFPLHQQRLRLETYVTQGTTISSKFDPMIAKLIVTGIEREEAIREMSAVLSDTRVHGVTTNLDQLRAIINSDNFRHGDFQTDFLQTFSYESDCVEVLDPGFYSSIQDLGRIGYWKIGIPPSGAYDPLNCRLANALLGNEESAPVLECTFSGPRLRLHCDLFLAVAGDAANMEIELSGQGVQPLSAYCAHFVPRGSVLYINRISRGMRCYLAVRGGFQSPLYLDSASTFPLGKIGGFTGDVLKTGDYLSVIPSRPDSCQEGFTLPDCLRPELGKPSSNGKSSHWVIHCMVGPFASDEYTTKASMDQFFQEIYKVHFNSNRLGIRLIGKSLEWVRQSGGSAGLHPSNLHDYVYQIGALNFTGDTPIIIGVDGPSLGGFVTNICIISSELWKVGQIKPGDTLRFENVSYDTARQSLHDQRRFIAAVKARDLTNVTPLATSLEPQTLEDSNYGILALLGETSEKRAEYRAQSDLSILVLYGEDEISIPDRFKIETMISRLKHDGVMELCPGVRSVQVNFDADRITRSDLLHLLMQLHHQMDLETINKVPSRLVHLPLSFDDPCVKEAINLYTKSVTSRAAYLPSNIEFLRRANGLADIEAVRDVLSSATYLVLGLGDVYMSSTCAVPVDPRHRIVASKYNPARTWTQHGTIGIGGSYMCSYGISSPGGYQLVGRSLGVFQRFPRHAVFGGNPWFLRTFDQIRFYLCSADELMSLRRQFENGKLQFSIEETEFDLSEYLAFEAKNHDSIAEFQQRQAEHLEAEARLWHQEGFIGENAMVELEENCEMDQEMIDDDEEWLRADVSGRVWRINVTEGDTLSKGDIILQLELMKMQFSISAPYNMTVRRIVVKSGSTISSGDRLMVIRR